MRPCRWILPVLCASLTLTTACADDEADLLRSDSALGDPRSPQEHARDAFATAYREAHTSAVTKVALADMPKSIRDRFAELATVNSDSSSYCIPSKEQIVPFKLKLPTGNYLGLQLTFRDDYQEGKLSDSFLIYDSKGTPLYHGSTPDSPLNAPELHWSTDIDDVMTHALCPPN